MNIKCSVVQDLLPSYIDGICKDETNTIVETHLSSCKECSELLEMARLTPADSKPDIHSKAPFAKVKKDYIKKNILLFVFSFIITLIAVFLIKQFLFDVVKIEGASMEPTIYAADQVVLIKLGYKPAVGDVVILEPPQDQTKLYIKRIIAVEGQTIDLRDGYVYVNGEKLNEPYLPEGELTNPAQAEFPIVVKPGHVFVMGDNRSHSWDSRSIGQIPAENIYGKVTYRFWPINKLAPIK